ncbi:MAG TPA: hypothetical protein VGN64_24120 [Dyadobacter sp.]|jgi:hypothetical protein|nr:hypothetical protein [Dyadobacter sp.]
MKKIVLGIFLLVVTALSAVNAQDCMGFNLKAGSGFEMDNFDGKGKPTGKLIYKVASVTNENGFVVYTIDFESLSSKGKSDLKNTYKMRCKGNVLSLDTKSLVSQEQMKSLENFEMKFTSDDIEYPAKLKAGEKLKDATLKGEGASGPLTMTMNMLISNRMVGEQEKLTIPAGTFDVHKVSADMLMETQMGIKIKIDMHTVSYRADGVLWDLKTETYRKGKLMASSVLTKIY